ncbi:MAG: LVIVD repeat-containing protein [Actinomycetes bacterium]
MKLRAALMIGALAGSVAFAPAPATDLSNHGVGTDNFTLVKNVPHSAGGRGSDIEFATYTFDTVDDVPASYFAPGRSGAADADPATAGIQKDIALAGTTGTRLYLYDVTVPAESYQTAAYECPANQGDTQVFRRDGRVYTTLTVEDGGSAVNANVTCAKDAGLKPGQGTEGTARNYTGTFIIDITDPFAPKAVSFISVKEGSHNGTVHPSGMYFYNSNSSLITEQAGIVSPTLGDGQPGIEYYDISDLQNPKRLGKLILPPIPASLGTESHDITFNAKGDRAYTAALSQGGIIDTSNPAAPKLLSSWVDPTINVWHQADPITIGDRTLLVVEDEVAGAVGTGQCPNGGVHVFDVTGDPAVPTKLGYWNIDEPRVMAADGSPATSTCTAHVFRLYPEAGLMTISYYNGGVRVVDLNGLIGIGLGGREVVGNPTTNADPMVQLGFRRFPNSNSWAAKSPRIPVDADGNYGDFWVFSNDSRGLDVLKFTAGNAAAEAEAAAFSRWMTPAEAARVLPTNLSAQQVRDGLSPYSCLLKAF